MGNSSEGAQKGVETTKRKYGEDHYIEIGAKGGRKSKGRKVSLETKRKISESLKKGRYANNQTSI